MSGERKMDLDVPTVDELKDVFQRAASVAAVVPEHLQAAAFSKAVDEILGDGQNRGDGRRRSRVSNGRGAKKPTPSASTPNASRRPAARRGAGPQTVIEAMIDEGFFDSPQPLARIVQSLEEERGYHFIRRRVATALLRLLRAQRLERSRNTAGDFEYSRR